MLRLFSLLVLSAAVIRAADESPVPGRKENTVVLDETAIKNIGLETAEAEEQDFEETALVLGAINVLPGKRAVVSTRIPGRAKTVLAKPDMTCEAGDEMLWVESRQPGDPPPVVRLDAPIGGLIAKVNAAEGQPVEPSDSLVEIHDLSIVEAHAAVPQHLAGRIGKGMEARIRVPGFDGREWVAEMAHLGAEADTASGTVEAAFHVENSDGVLRPGMRAEFTLVLRKTPGVQAVPRDAVQGDGVNRYVFIRDYELQNAFVKSPVVTGLTNDRYVEITEGLLPGDEVVIKGAYTLAFAGKGSTSLKEALDAAHGHPHNEDGSEMTPEQIAAAAEASGGPDHGHEHSDSPFWKIASGVLFALLVVSLAFQRRGAAESKPEPA